MTIKEGPLSPKISTNLVGAAAEGAAMINVALDLPPLKIIEAINAFVANPPPGGSEPIDNWTDRAMPLGSLWGTQMVRQFGWEWTAITQNEEGGIKGIAVFDKQRSIGLYPFHFVFGCLESGSYPTILLAFNMLLAGKIPEMDAGEYVNLMDGVRHVVPPR